MRTGDVATRLGVSPETIRNYVRDFGDFLSDQKGKHRSYTGDDIDTLATIRQLYDDKLAPDAIREKLSEGYRLKLDDVPSGIYRDLVPLAAVDQIKALAETRQALEGIQAERDKLQAEVEALKEELRTSTKENADLRERVGRAEGRLEELAKRRRWFGRE